MYKIDEDESVCFILSPYFLISILKALPLIVGGAGVELGQLLMSFAHHDILLLKVSQVGVALEKPQARQVGAL